MTHVIKTAAPAIGLFVGLCVGCSHRQAPAADEGGDLCGAVPAPGPLRKVASEVSVASFGLCGHLQYVDVHDGLWLMAPDLTGSPNAVAGRILDQARFAPTGDRLAYIERTTTDRLLFRVRALAGDDSGVSAPVRADLRHHRYPSLGFVRSAPGPSLGFICDLDALRVFDGDRQVFRRAEAGARCGMVVAAGSALVFSDASHRLRTVDAADLAARRLQLEYWAERPAPEGRRSRDTLALSNDGRVLVHRRTTWGDCNSGQMAPYPPSPGPCPLTEATRLTDLRRGVEIGMVATKTDPLIEHTMGHSNRAERGLLQARDGGHVLLFSTASSRISYVTRDLELRHLGGAARYARPLHLFGDERTALVQRWDNGLSEQTGRIDLDNPASFEPIPDGERFAVSRGDAAIAADTRPPGCVKDTRSSFCQPTSGISVWRRGKSEVVARSLLPLKPLWVGDDGTTLVLGGIHDRALPAAGDLEALRRSARWGLHLISSTGRILHSGTSGGEIQLEPKGGHQVTGPWVDDFRVWEVEGALLVKLFRETAQGKVWRLDRIDRSTGGRRELVEGKELEVLLDSSRRRLAYLVDGVLWAGAVPGP